MESVTCRIISVTSIFTVLETYTANVKLKNLKVFNFAMSLSLKVNLPIQNYCLKVNDTWHGITSRYIEFISEIKFIGLRASRRVISSAI